MRNIGKGSQASAGDVQHSKEVRSSLLRMAGGGSLRLQPDFEQGQVSDASVARVLATSDISAIASCAYGDEFFSDRESAASRVEESKMHNDRRGGRDTQDPSRKGKGKEKLENTNMAHLVLARAKCKG